MPETFDTSSGLGGGIDTHVPSIDGPLPGTEVADQGGETTADAETEQVEQSSTGETEQGSTDETTSEAQPVYAKDALINQLINKFAKDHPNLDPTDPQQLKILTRMAHQEKFIRELKGKQQPADNLTEFERALFQPPAAQQQPQNGQPPQQPQQPQQPGAQESIYGPEDAGVSWKSPKDAYTDLAKAWTNQDLDTVNRIELAIAQRRASALGLLNGEQVTQLVQQALQDALGDVLPSVRESVESQRSHENKEFAIAELEKSGGQWSGIRDLEKEITGPPIVVNGQQFPNTRLNQILVENPEILDIRVVNKDPNVAEKLTYLARYRAVMRAEARGTVDNKKAGLLLEAGSKMAQRQMGDRVRQGLNSGSGVTGLPNGKKTGSFVESLLNVDGGPRSFSEL
jgi:hypothetical protein